jgi:predicted metal-dependent enzyme (double-stranded beta helix superfamily)
MTTSLTPDPNQLRQICALTTELALRKAASFLSHLVKDPDFVDSRILPFLDVARYGEDWYVAHRHDAEDGSFSLQVFVWPPGTAIKIHDHSSSGAYCCAIGSVLEERYERLDDGSRPDHARLKEVWQLSWSSEDGASTVQPRDGGIHQVGNPGKSTAISVHLYGPQIGDVDGRG